MGKRRERSVLFLSADLVGSTSFKQSTPGWQKVFLSFYREFPQYLQGQATDFSLWKAIGDELVFEVNVEHERHVSSAVRSWLKAMERYENEVLADAGLSLKGGAFIATFPGPDSESTIPRKPEVEISDESVVILNQSALKGTKAHSKFLYDYFGPSIDTGFRIFGFATQRYFSMTVEVAWAISAAAQAAGADPAKTQSHYVSDFEFVGLHSLKGVWGGRDYPVFAIDRHSGDPVNAAVKVFESNGISAQSILDVCSACHQDSKWKGALYLPESDNTGFRNVPDDAMADLLEGESTHDGAESVIKPNKDAEAGESLSSDPPLGEPI